MEELDKQCKEIDYLIQKEDKNITKVGMTLMDIKTEEASIAEEIHNAISTIKTFIQRIVDFLLSKVRTRLHALINR